MSAVIDQPQNALHSNNKGWCLEMNKKDIPEECRSCMVLNSRIESLFYVDSLVSECYVLMQIYDFTSEDLQDTGEIGRGAFGTVNKMIHRKSNTVMAVKVSLVVHFIFSNFNMTEISFDKAEEHEEEAMIHSSRPVSLLNNYYQLTNEKQPTNNGVFSRYRPVLSCGLGFNMNKKTPSIEPVMPT